MGRVPVLEPGNTTWLSRLRARVLTRENLVAVGLCLLLIALVIVTADTAPRWIYQGF